MEIFYSCWECGGRATRTRLYERSISGSITEVSPNKKVRCYCEECLKIIIEQEKTDHEMYIRLKKQEMFNAACSMIEKQGNNMNKLKEAIEVVHEHLINNPDKYDSSYEVASAIILISNRIVCKTQYKVGKYQVDFLLPEQMVVLEIDGERHRHRKDYDSARDKEIKKILGAGWEVVRIDTKFLDQNIKKLVDAIFVITEHRDKDIL